MELSEGGGGCGGGSGSGSLYHDPVGSIGRGPRVVPTVLQV